ncbi:MAG TPA: hypothetical protein EYN51_05650 [Flavobacteriales bacterium]|nr:hypothetical protein [Flavobacteriales bacterium]
MRNIQVEVVPSLMISIGETWQTTVPGNIPIGHHIVACNIRATINSNRYWFRSAMGAIDV